MNTQIKEPETRTLEDVEKYLRILIKVNYKNLSEVKSEYAVNRINIKLEVYEDLLKYVKGVN